MPWPPHHDRWAGGDREYKSAHCPQRGPGDGASQRRAFPSEAGSLPGKPGGCGASPFGPYTPRAAAGLIEFASESGADLIAHCPRSHAGALSLITDCVAREPRRVSPMTSRVFTEGELALTPQGYHRDQGLCRRRRDSPQPTGRWPLRGMLTSEPECSIRSPPSLQRSSGV